MTIKVPMSRPGIFLTRAMALIWRVRPAAAWWLAHSEDKALKADEYTISHPDSGRFLWITDRWALKIFRPFKIRLNPLERRLIWREVVLGRAWKA